MSGDGGVGLRFEPQKDHRQSESRGWTSEDSAARLFSDLVGSLFTAGAKPEIGFLFVLLLPSLAAISSFKNIYIGGVNYLAFVTLLTPLLLVFVMVVKAGLDPSRLRAWPGHRVWLAWLGMIWGSLLWGEVRDGEAFKHAYEMSTPYVFGLAGAMFVRTHRQLTLFFYAILFALIPSLGCVAAWKLGLVEVETFPSGPALDPRPHSMSLLPIAALALAFFPSRIVITVIAWTICLLVSGIEGSRGVTLCILVLPMFHPLFRGLLWKLVAAVGVMLMGLVVFHLPAMQKRLFPEAGSGTISDLFASGQHSMGRLEAWPLVIEKGMDTPLLGHGISSVFHYVPTIWDRMRSVHNEFIGTFYELGLLGLAVYIGAMVYQMVLLRKRMRDAFPANKIALTTVYLALIAFNIMACTDNPMSSNVRFLNPLFLLMGASFCAGRYRGGATSEFDGDRLGGTVEHSVDKTVSRGEKN
ncbi:O-Antigen ligase [Novipirellula galeiformis]|uniref:O-Antigen ligase n=1 Tax=Novipirellula galeiformis TaxID=2528004 RepID=A0A5C6CIA6_9BACT|nr:O-antigen ligase family protein [Novipirellula galeiformis]TWU24012.1 O-Antigen ligase [Novipirellula galeiformis]